MIPYMVGKLAPNLSHLTRGLVKYVPGRGYFRAVSLQNGDTFVTSPPPQSLNGSGVLPETRTVLEGLGGLKVPQGRIGILKPLGYKRELSW